MSTGENIAKMRKKLNMSQEELAAELFVSRSLVSLWELDLRFPDYGSVERMSRLFGAEPKDIIPDKRYGYANGGKDEVIAELSECIGDVPDGVDLTEIAEKFIKKLGGRSREIFMSRYFKTESCKSIAERLNISESNVRSRLSRLRQKLKKEVEKNERRE